MSIICLKNNYAKSYSNNRALKLSWINYYYLAKFIIIIIEADEDHFKNYNIIMSKNI